MHQLKVATEVYFHQVHEHTKRNIDCGLVILANWLAIPSSSNFGPVFVEINWVFAGTRIGEIFDRYSGIS